MNAPTTPTIRPEMSPAVVTLMTASGEELQKAPVEDIMDYHRWADAYHEAGHAIVAFEVGHWISPEGVEIDDRQYCGHRCLGIRYNPYDTILISLAGWLTEHRFHGRGRTRHSDEPDEFAYVLQMVRDGYDEDLEELGDLGEVAGALLMVADDDEDDDALLVLLREFEDEVLEVISKPEAWSAIETLAGALIGKGKLLPDEIDELLPAPYRRCDWQREHDAA